MIRVSRLNGSAFYVNAEWILYVEANPDTVITLTDGKKLVVSESSEEVVQAVIDYRRQVNTPWVAPIVEEKQPDEG